MVNEELANALKYLFLKGDYDENIVNFISSLNGPEAILPITKTLKDEGNSYFKNGNVSLAKEKYDRALKFLCFCMPLSDTGDLLYVLAISLMLNFPACALRLNNFDEVGVVCSAILEFDACNVKALYRRALALLGLNLFEEAWGDLTKAANFEPGNKDILRELEKVERSLGKFASGDGSGGGGGGRRKRKLDLETSLTCKKDLMDASGFVEDALPKRSEAVNALSNGLNPLIDSPIEKGSGKDLSTPGIEGMECEVDSSSLLNDSETINSPLGPTKILQFCNRRRKDHLLSLSQRMYDKILQGEEASFFHPFQKCRNTVRVHHPNNAEAGTSKLALTPFSDSDTGGHRAWSSITRMKVLTVWKVIV